MQSLAKFNSFLLFAVEGGEGQPRGRGGEALWRSVGQLMLSDACAAD